MFSIPLHSPQLDATSNQTPPPALNLQVIRNSNVTDSDNNSDLDIIQSLFQPSWSESRPISPNTDSVHVSARNYLNGIGAWQIDPHLAFGSIHSSSSTGESTQDQQARAHYPDLPNTNTIMNLPSTYDAGDSRFIQCPSSPSRDRPSSVAQSERRSSPRKLDDDDLEPSICGPGRCPRHFCICPIELIEMS